MQLFYSTQITDNTIRLSEEETRHLKVLRKSVGDALHVTDGCGTLYTCELLDIGKKEALLKINSTQKQNYPWEKLHLYIGALKNTDRLEWMVEKLTEIGVGKIGIFISDNAERRALKTDRLQRKAESAIKQSLKYKLPELLPVLPLDELMKALKQKQVLIAHCSKLFDAAPPAKWNVKADEVHMLIGPEGDFSEKEIETAINYGFIPVSLGDSRLRTETAAVVACTLLNQIIS